MPRFTPTQTLRLPARRVTLRPAVQVAVLVAGVRAMLIGVMAVATAGVVTASPARADPGVAIDVGRIDIEEVLHPGSRYTLPAIGVRNPGSRPSTYTLAVRPLHTEHQPVPDAWVTFTPPNLELDPDEKQPVEPVVQVPDDATPGTYEALLAAQLTTPGDGPRVGAAAAAILTFTIGDHRPQPETDRGWVINGGWMLTALTAVILIVIVPGMTRFRIRFERRPSRSS